MSERRMLDPTPEERAYDEGRGICHEERVALKAEVAELESKCEAISNAGHSADCGGWDANEGRCGCGWLQREGAAQYIVSIEDDRDRLATANELLGRQCADLEHLIRTPDMGDDERWEALIAMLDGMEGGHISDRASELEADRDRLAKENARLRVAAGTLVSTLDDLVSESFGVAGLHANGEVAPWSTIFSGGEFEEWLGVAVLTLEAALAKDKS